MVHASVAGKPNGLGLVQRQLDDKTELMLFELRRKDGTPDPFSSGTYIAADGRAHHLSANDFTLQPLDRWTSAKTGGRYPIAWRIRVPSFIWICSATRWCRTRNWPARAARNIGKARWIIRLKDGRRLSRNDGLR